MAAERIARRVFAALALVSSLALAQTTGGLGGRVADETGGVLPGVTVTASSPVLQGTRVAVTDESGAWRIALLPPGPYTVTFDLAGFASDSAEGVVVSLGRDSALTIVLRPRASEEITVTGEAATIDQRTTTIGTNLSTQAIESLPSGRNYASIVQVASGVASDANPENSSQSTISFYGSSGAENTFYIDGVNTTGVEYGFQGKELNFEFIQAVDVKAGGYEAEFGRSTGGIVNVVTKSGGNEFHGDLFGYFDDDSLQSSPDPTVDLGGQLVGYSRQDFGADLGGYLIRDALWFFAAYDRVDNTDDRRLAAGPQAGQVEQSDRKSDLAAIKLTWNLAPAQSLVGSFFQDPGDESGAISDRRIDHSLNGLPSTYLGVQEFGGRDLALRYEGVIGENWVLTGQIARHEEENSTSPAGGGDVIQLRDFTGVQDGFQTGGFGQIVAKEFTRESWGGSVERFLGAHDLKAGLEFETQEAQVVKRMSGGQRVDVFEGTSGLDVFSHFYWTTPTATVANAPTSQLDATPSHDNTTVFLQDRWQALPNLTVSAGVRWDRQEIIDRFGDGVIDLDDDYAPRIGFTWDPEKQGKSKLFGSYGRYFEQIPMDLVIRSFAQERQARIFNYSPTSTAPDAAAEADLERESTILGGFFEPADPNMENQYIEEVLLGYEREVMPNLAVGAKLILREYGQVIEDFLCANPETGELDGTYCIGNPGEGLMSVVFGYDSFYDDDPAVDAYPAPKAERDYRGVELEARKRFADGWQMTASYLWSKLEGNYDGAYAPFTNVGADPNISAAYDYFDFFTDGEDLNRITNDGPLSNDRRHQFKASGYYLTSFDLSIGGSAYYRSGTPLTRYGFSDGYGRYEFFLTPRGAEGRAPSIYEASVHFGYPVDAGPVKINFLLDVFNILNAQRPILLDQRWDFQEADNTSPVPTNPNYGEPVLRTPPTSFRLGVRLSF